MPRAPVAPAEMDRPRDILGQALEDPPVRRDAAVHERVERRPVHGGEDAQVLLVEQHRVQRVVHLDVPQAGGDRVVHLLALDGHHVLDQLLVAVVHVLRDAVLVDERQLEERRRRERDLEARVGDRPQELGLADSRAVDPPQPPAHHGEALVALLVPGGVVERHAVTADLQPLDAVVERAGEHEAAELAVGHDLEADPALVLDCLPDAGVLELVQAAEILLALLGEQRRVLRRVDALDLGVELPWAQQASHVVRARRSWT